MCHSCCPDEWCPMQPFSLNSNSVTSRFRQICKICTSTPTSAYMLCIYRYSGGGLDTACPIQLCYNSAFASCVLYRVLDYRYSRSHHNCPTIRKSQLHMTASERTRSDLRISKSQEFSRGACPQAHLARVAFACSHTPTNPVCSYPRLPMPII